MDSGLSVKFTNCWRRAIKDAIRLAGHFVIVSREPGRQVPELPFIFAGRANVLIVVDWVHASRVIARICLRPAHRNPGFGMLGPAPNHGYADPGNLGFHLRDRVGDPTDHGNEGRERGG